MKVIGCLKFLFLSFLSSTISMDTISAEEIHYQDAEAIHEKLGQSFDLLGPKQSLSCVVGDTQRQEPNWDSSEPKVMVNPYTTQINEFYFGENTTNDSMFLPLKARLSSLPELFSSLSGLEYRSSLVLARVARGREFFSGGVKPGPFMIRISESSNPRPLSDHCGDFYVYSRQHLRHNLFAFTVTFSQPSYKKVFDEQLRKAIDGATTGAEFAQGVGSVLQDMTDALGPNDYSWRTVTMGSNRQFEEMTTDFSSPPDMEELRAYYDAMHNNASPEQVEKYNIDPASSLGIISAVTFDTVNFDGTSIQPWNNEGVQETLSRNKALSERRQVAEFLDKYPRRRLGYDTYVNTRIYETREEARNFVSGRSSVSAAEILRDLNLVYAPYWPGSRSLRGVHDMLLKAKELSSQGREGAEAYFNYNNLMNQFAWVVNNFGPYEKTLVPEVTDSNTEFSIEELPDSSWADFSRIREVKVEDENHPQLWVLSTLLRTDILSLKGSTLDDQNLKYLTNLRYLEVLDLSHTSGYDSTAFEGTWFQSFSELRLQGSPIKDIESFLKLYGHHMRYLDKVTIYAGQLLPGQADRACGQKIDGVDVECL